MPSGDREARGSRYCNVASEEVFPRFSDDEAALTDRAGRAGGDRDVDEEECGGVFISWKHGFEVC